MPKWKKRVLLVFLSFCFAFLAAELTLRILGITYPILYTYDERGGALLPGAKGWWIKEGHAYVQINSDGNRDFEHEIRKPEGVFRIAVLGDSYAEALAVEVTNTFWWIMGDELNNKSGIDGKKVEVLNFGVSGYGTARELLTLRSKVWKYTPDLVLLAFLTGNDISDNSKKLKLDASVPYFILKGDELILDDSYLNDRNYVFYSSVMVKYSQLIINKSYLLQLINESRYSRKSRKAACAQSAARLAVDISNHSSTVGSVSVLSPSQRGGCRGGAFIMTEAGLNDNIYKEPLTEDWKEAWQITENLIFMMNREVLDKGAKFVVAILSNGIEVHPDPKVRSQYADQLGVTNLCYAENRITALCNANGVPVINLASQMCAYAEQYNVFLHGFQNTQLGAGHWNETGHRVAGRKIADYILGVYNKSRE